MEGVAGEQLGSQLEAAARSTCHPCQSHRRQWCVRLCPPYRCVPLLQNRMWTQTEVREVVVGGVSRYVLRQLLVATSGRGETAAGFGCSGEEKRVLQPAVHLDRPGKSSRSSIPPSCWLVFHLSADMATTRLPMLQYLESDSAKFESIIKRVREGKWVC